jgi:hypothetical protein
MKRTSWVHPRPLRFIMRIWIIGVMVALAAMGCGPRLSAITLGDEPYVVGFSKGGVMPLLRHIEPPEGGRIPVVAGPPLTERWAAETDPLPSALEAELNRRLSDDDPCPDEGGVFDVEITTDASLMLNRPLLIDTSNFWFRKYDVSCTSELTGRVVAQLCQRTDARPKADCSDIAVPLDAGPVDVVGIECLGLTIGESHHDEWTGAHDRLFAAVLEAAKSRCAPVRDANVAPGR